MEGLYKLKDMLCQELEEYGNKDELCGIGDLAVIDTLAHATKNVIKVIDHCEGKDSAHGENMNDSLRSNDNEKMVSELRGLMGETSDESMRYEFQRFIERIESL